MAYTGPNNGMAVGGLHPDAADPAYGQPGYRRKKFTNFLKAANEVRQTYFAADGSMRDGSEDHAQTAFPDAQIKRSGNEEMMLFPSYARKHVKNKFTRIPGSQTEREYWEQQWDKHQNDNAIVDVDVHGWIYVPHKGQNTRKHRLMVGVARQLAGLPAPPTNKSSESLPSSSEQSRVPSPTEQQEEDLISFEADNIVKRGRAEMGNAQRGAYTENPYANRDDDSIYRGASPERSSRLSHMSRASSDSPPSSPSLNPISKRPSWNQPSKMTPAELTVANNHLVSRLRPFLHNPLVETPISAFFYNDTASRQLTVYTNEKGHFTFHAALDFVPTHVRVLAGEKLSATEQIHITSPKGVSLISDIDDTVKHSNIGASYAEIFRNVFIRELHDLTIDGVREWYNTLSDMGVKLHYVSNSPWQLYPVLTSYFKMARLPIGSFHLKQYSGMLGGIFEPVAERKKGSLDKIMRDFPDRRFILVGDSGEADLEVYTDVALDNPGRVLGIFIRDVTTPTRTGYFDPSGAPGSGSSSAKHSRNHSRNRSGDSLAKSKRLSRPDDIRDDDEDLKAAIAASLADMEEEARQARKSINPDKPAHASLDGVRETDRLKPQLPPRRRNGRLDSGVNKAPSPEEDLIDLNEELAPPKPWLEPLRRTTSPQGPVSSIKESSNKPTPSPPPKPIGLRSTSPHSQRKLSQEGSDKQPPPRPRKPSSSVKPPSPQPPQQDSSIGRPPSAHGTVQPQQLQTHQPSPLSQVSRQDSTASRGAPPLPVRPKGVGRFGAYWHGRPPSAHGSVADSPRLMSGSSSTKSSEDLRGHSTAMQRAGGPPMPPPRRANAPVPTHGFATAARMPTNRMSGTWDLDVSPLGSPSEAGMSTKERLWKQRWEKAQSLLDPRGVTLRSWRVGSDVADVAVKLAEMEFRKIEREERESLARNERK
ncbi:actin patch protein 1 [Hortaea werneckii]|nr:actin patch protein 1 [Hortaea werneckii]KAI7102686.1 actin patch protein 1 [Hortaea werneckii]KAI7226371.1 actin patch protein 1 [Hortaea werneckii]KAI7304929.1 actin patch protein 1 [Hortaea werneckii]KAI7354109.1 actin patch protein 1 [Hortaea werneckii]